MDFSQQFRDDTRIFTIKRILKERHGKIDNLQLCFHSFSESNEVHDEMLTLYECGIKGFPVGAAVTDEDIEMEEKSIPIVKLFYDFKPADKSDAVLLFFR